jgi:hypothetical protein
VSTLSYSCNSSLHSGEQVRATIRERFIILQPSTTIFGDTSDGPHVEIIFRSMASRYFCVLRLLSIPVCVVCVCVCVRRARARVNGAKLQRFSIFGRETCDLLHK